uniref:Uncharacterized protein n=1 Tax=Nelumbo nucifera TaxID=4432 RepID=A0A822ZL97_NELNU|nr:TPA_asm: hypothetical protein HUJ06_002455 [Nelumbo nucifera]
MQPPKGDFICAAKTEKWSLLGFGRNWPAHQLSGSMKETSHMSVHNAPTAQ